VAQGGGRQHLNKNQVHCWVSSHVPRGEGGKEANLANLDEPTIYTPRGKGVDQKEARIKVSGVEAWVLGREGFTFQDKGKRGGWNCGSLAHGSWGSMKRKKRT